MKIAIFPKTLLYLTLIGLAIIWIYPLIFMAFTAFKTPADLFSKSLFSPPTVIVWGNLWEAWTQGNMNVYMKNSIFISIIKVPLGILVASLAAFAITRLDFKWSTFTFIFFLTGLTIPFQATLVPLNIMLTKTGMIDTHAGLIFIYIAFGLPFAILILRGFFRAIPKELDDAAKIDGCSSLGLFARIIMPISMPAIATLFILDFLSTWNEFLFAQIFLRSDHLRTVPTGLLAFKGEFNTNYPLLNAGVLISVIPVLIVYLLFQRFFVQGFAGSVKG